MSKLDPKLIAAFAVFIVVCLGAAVGIGLAWRGYQTSIRDSRRTVAELERENRELTDRLGRIQDTITGIGTGIEAASGTVGNVTGEIGDVITGLDESIRILGELIEAIERIEKILNSTDTPAPAPPNINGD